MLSSSYAESYGPPAKYQRTLYPDERIKNLTPRYRQETDILAHSLDKPNSYFKTLKPDIFFVRFLNDGSYEELLLVEVKMNPSISDRNLPQLINYLLPTVVKQGNTLGLFFTAINAMLVKLEKKNKYKRNQ